MSDDNDDLNFRKYKAEALSLSQAERYIRENDEGTVPAQGYNIENRKLSDSIKAATVNLDRYEMGDFSQCTSTGLRTLDQKLGGGFHAGQVTLIGAPTGHGKTTLLVAMAAEASKRGPVLLVSPEMSAVELAQREIIRISRYPQWDRNPWKVTPQKDEASRAHVLAANRILTEDLPLYCLDDLDVTMLDVEAAASELRFKTGAITMVAIDYAQEVADLDSKTPRYLQVGAVATRSIMLARELKIPVVIASQINQTKDHKGNVTQSFRESQILEHKSHNVLLFEVRWEESLTGEIRRMDKAEFVCRKQRNGPTFRLQVAYQPDVYRVSDYGGWGDDRA
jgi:replicative DNA helicase